MGASPNPQTNSPPIMGFTMPASRTERRQKAAQLILAVLEETMEPRMAINRWPESCDLPDPSLDCAYMALWHFEADETQQKTEMFYMDAQLELLRQIADYLKGARDLPPHMLRTYLPSSSPIRFYYARSVWEDSVYQVKQLWNRVRDIFSQAFSLIR